jgi:hypothetical protein
MGKSKIAAKLDIDAYLKTLALGTIKTLGKAALAEVQKERDDVKKTSLLLRQTGIGLWVRL